MRDAVQTMADGLTADADVVDVDESWADRCREAAATIVGRSASSGSRKPAAPDRNWRDLIEWDHLVIQFLTPREFQRLYRLPSYALFTQVADHIAPHLTKRTKHASTLKGGSVPVQIHLACTLRYLAGGSYLDIAINHGVSPNHVHKVVRRTVGAILDEFGSDAAVGLAVEKVRG